MQVRIGVGEQGDLKHVHPQVREATPLSWWGDVPLAFSSLQSTLCQDVDATSVQQPATLWVRTRALVVDATVLRIRYCSIPRCLQVPCALSHGILRGTEACGSPVHALESWMRD